MRIRARGPCGGSPLAAAWRLAGRDQARRGGGRLARGGRGLT
ncbi:hypothetical protein AXXA_30367 [Achromobacter insuavis AXX-A]|uniref:Uncharacterized protein n=1 Tax=Achromobacter insuavis AXX-A TaxID=1003200 RepID=F7TAS1_9BURK|nr:hypothetical protein AXXA_30367 [Achromobacter insuavis AXX-A]